jgi:ABC-type uncharacterized transport system auxiliary subunit
MMMIDNIATTISPADRLNMDYSTQVVVRAFEQEADKQSSRNTISIS